MSDGKRGNGNMSDLIRREDAIKAINLRARIPHDVASAYYASMAINAIYSVPSADRPLGEWIRTIFTDCGSPIDECSNCGHYINGDMKVRNFCPNCGARMKGADDD